MFRTHSRPLVDAIINHPDVRPTIERGSHRLSSKEVLDNFRNFVYAGEHGMIAFLYEREGVYKGHIAMLKSGRGSIAVREGRACLGDFFRKLEPSVVHASVPLQLRGARLFCRLVGFRSTGADEKQEFFVY